MSNQPKDFYNNRKPGQEIISDASKTQLLALGYKDWLKKEQEKGYYKDAISHYDPQTIKEFLIYYRKNEQEKWNESKPFGHLAMDGNNLAEFNILSAFVGYSDVNIKALIHETNQNSIYPQNKISPQNKTLESFISDVHRNRNRTFNDVNKVNPHQVGSVLGSLCSIISRIVTFAIKLKKGTVKKNGPLKEVPRASEDTQSFRKTQSMSINYKSPNHEAQSLVDDSKKRKRSDQQYSGPAQEYPKKTKSEGGLNYFYAFRSNNKNQLEKAEDARFEREKKFQEMKEAEKIRKEEEAKQKAKNTRPPKRTSSPPPLQVQVPNFSLIQKLED